MVNAVEASLGAIDVLINNAAVAQLRQSMSSTAI